MLYLLTSVAMLFVNVKCFIFIQIIFHLFYINSGALFLFISLVRNKVLKKCSTFSKSLIRNNADFLLFVQY